MEVMLAKSPMPMLFAAGQVHRMRGEWVKGGPLRLSTTQAEEAGRSLNAAGGNSA